IGSFAARDGPEKYYGMAGTLKVCGHRDRDVVEDAHDAEHWSGLDADAARLVIQRDVAAGDGRAEHSACFRDAVDGVGKLSHNFGLLRISEVEAVCGGDGDRARRSNFAGAFGHGVHCAELGVEPAPAAIAVEGHGETAFLFPLFPRSLGPCTFDSHYARFATGADHSVGLHHGIVLLVYPALGADVG